MGKVIPLFRSKDTGTTYEVEESSSQEPLDSSEDGELREYLQRGRRQFLCSAARGAARHILKMTQGRFSPTRLRNMQELVRDYSDDQIENFLKMYSPKRNSLDKPAFAYAIAKEADRRFCLLSDRIRH